MYKNLNRFYWRLVALMGFVFWSISCVNSNGTSSPVKSDTTLLDSVSLSKSISEVKIKETPLLVREDLMDVQELNDQILVDLKYNGTDNFTKIKLYNKITKAYLQKEVAAKLSKAQDLLSEIHAGYHLLVYDAIRPREVQYKMWNALDSIPVSKRINFVSNPKNGSIHNYGAAVDLTITDEQGRPLDMGAGYDDPRKIAYPIYEKKFLQTGELLLEHVENRKLLRGIMKKAGFFEIPSEWWHFNACTRSYAKAHYKIVEKEEDIFIEK